MTIKSFSAISLSIFFACQMLFASTAAGLTYDEAWSENATEAIEKAVKENKDLFLLFTGSDWCPPCQKLEKEVLSNDDFQFEVTQHFVLVKFDFPKKTPLDEKTTLQNDEFAKKFGVDQYPTVILADAELKPFAIAGYEEGGFQNYLGMLEEARQLRINRDEKLQAAAGKKGLERATLLDEAISGIRSEIIELYYPDIVTEIIELDKEDQLGLRTKWNEANDTELRKIMMTDITMISRLEKPKRAIEFIDEVMKEIDFPATDKLQILQIKLNLVRQLDDSAKIDGVLDEMIELDGVEGTTRERLIVKKVYLMMGQNRDDEAMKLLERAIGDGGDVLNLYLAKGEILDSKKKHADAIEAYSVAIVAAKSSPDVLIDLISAKADSLFELKQEAEALQILDNFSDDTQMPTDLRAEALLHKAMMMRAMKRSRPARLAENRAIEITESPQQRAEMQKIVDRLRAKYEK